jgi:hypothetical protein
MNRRAALGACAALAAAPILARTARAGDVKVERVVAKVGRNHGHALVVSPADVLAGVKSGVARTYDLSGTSGHAHEVTLTAEDFKQLQAGATLRMPSTRYAGNGHLHRLLIKAAPLVDPPESVAVCEATFSGKDDHELVVSAPDLAGGVEKTLDVQGIAPHAHAVTLTAGDFERLRSGAEIKVRTTRGDVDDHTHLVFVRHPIKKP